MGEISMFHWLVIGGAVLVWWTIARCVRSFLAGYRKAGKR
jgi:hypothetical protein